MIHAVVKVLLMGYNAEIGRPPIVQAVVVFVVNFHPGRRIRQDAVHVVGDAATRKGEDFWEVCRIDLDANRMALVGTEEFCNGMLRKDFGRFSEGGIIEKLLVRQAL